MKKSTILKKTLTLILAVLLIMSLVSGCSKPSEPPTSGEPSNNSDNSSLQTGEKTAKDTITILVKAEPETLDPAYMNAEAISLVQQFIFDCLFTTTSEGKSIVELAETYEFIDDTTVKFKLRDDIKFSDGTNLTSEDIFFNFKRLQESPISASSYFFIDLENSTIEDDLNFTLKFTQPFAPFEITMDSGRASIYSKAAFEELGAEKFARNPIGTGPYKLVNWVSGTQIELTRNEYYWGEPAKTENIIIKFIAEPTARVIELETGAADIAYYIEGTDIERVNSIDGYKSAVGDSYRYFTFLYSMAEPLLQEVKVREALCYAIDKEALVKSTTSGIGKPINCYCPPATNGYMDLYAMPYDIEKAKELLAEAGYPDGFEIELHVEPNPLFERIAEAAQAMWAEIGIKAEIVVSPLATYDAQRNGKFQISIRDGAAAEISNVLIIYESTFGSRFNGSDDWLDAKLLELKTLYYSDPQREVTLKEIFDYLYDKKYSYPFMVMPMVYGVSEKLEGFEFHPAPANLVPNNWVIYE